MDSSKGDIKLKIALVQFNAKLGDLDGNREAIVALYKEAINAGADLVVLPELALCGYPPQDLLLKRHFLEDNIAELANLAADCQEKAIIVGFAEILGHNCYNSLAVIEEGRVVKIYRKHILPNYGVFDERRYFSRGQENGTVEIGGFKFGLSICEDIWESDFLPTLSVEQNYDAIINISASPFHMGKLQTRKEILKRAALKFDCPLCYCNIVGGQDELVFDGRSIFTDKHGKLISKAKQFEQDIIYASLERDDNNETSLNVQREEADQAENIIEEIYKALVLGTRDYIRKNGFKKVIIGLSGGIDSALVAAIAADAIGSENVVGVTMPSRFNSQETRSDAEELANNLGLEFHTIPISEPLESFDKMLSIVDGWDKSTTAYENLQARIRGTMLMSLSNQFGYMVLTTGNKSETAVGYSTLYGDTAGGFAVIKDVPKTIVYELCKYINDSRKTPAIPVSTITRPPSAELREGQKDSDSLPDYEILDALISGYVEQDLSANELAASGACVEDINRIIKMIDRNEYKRRQSPPGVKITPKAFGLDRRLPITNAYLTQYKEEKKD